MADRKQARRLVPLALFLLAICVFTAIDSTAKSWKSSSKKPSAAILTGKFVAEVNGPALTGFGVNQQSYVFQLFSPSGSQLVRVSDTFLVYEQHLPDRVLDYSKLFRVAAVRDDRCDETLENISRRFIFDSRGYFLETKYSLTYARNLPSFDLPWKSLLPCYSVSPALTGAKVVTEVKPETAAH